MSVTPSSTIVGVFRDPSEAEQAVNALYNSGFEQEQIQYMVPGTSGSFFEGLKNFLTGTNEGEGNLADDLTNMGLSDADAQYYANEYNNGNPILIVRAAERGTEAVNVLRQYGAYNTQTEPAGNMQQPGDYSQYGAASGQYNNTQNWGTQPQTQTTEEQSFAAPQPDNVAPEYDLHDQDTQPVPPLHDTEPQDMQASAATPMYDTGNQAFTTDTPTSEQEGQTPTTPLAMAAPHDNGDYQIAQVTEVTLEQDTNDQAVQSMPTDGDYQTAQATDMAPAHDTNDQAVQSISPEGEYQADGVTGVAPEHDTTDQIVQSMPVGYETTTAPQDVQPGVTVPGTNTTDQTTPVDTTTPEQASNTQVASTAITGNDAQPQSVAQSVPATSSQETEVQPAQANAVSPEQTDELQQLQAQLQTLQQQLQEMKARLSAAKEQENQIKTARERQQQLQSARQQLQDAQAELQATLAEYQEVQSRITQYQ